MAEAHPGPPDDAALVGAVVGGSQDALAALYDRHAAAVFGLAVRLTDDRQVAEEVVQETFLALWNRAELFDPAMGSLATWLHAIARNRAVDRLRAAGRRPRLVALEPADSDDGRGSPIDRLPEGHVIGGAAPDAAPDEAAERAELGALVRGALEAMPEDERTPIVLAYRDGLTQSEIAEQLGWPLGTVKTRTRRALARLREALGPAFAPSPIAVGAEGDAVEAPSGPAGPAGPAVPGDADRLSPTRGHDGSR
jgi:RNA polymerase sigma-70 factor (ECF subfamily)